MYFELYLYVWSIAMFELHMLESRLKDEEFMLIKAKCKLINTQGYGCTMRDRMIPWYGKQLSI